MDFGVAAQAIGEDRAHALIVEGGEITVTLQAVLLCGGLLQHAPVARAMWRVTDDTAISTAGLMREDEGASIFTMAFDTSFLSEGQIVEARAC